MYNKQLNEKERDSLSRKDLNDYWDGQEMNKVRDQFAMAALTGLLAGDRGDGVVQCLVSCAFDFADECMIERVK